MTIDRHLLAQFTSLGRWWQPATPERKVAGTLVFDPFEGARLQLEGTLGSDEIFNSEGADEVLLHGHLDDGRPCTVLHALDGGNSFQMNFNVTKQTFYCEELFLGGLLPSTDALIFASSSVAITSVSDWMGIHHFRRNSITDDGRTLGVDASFRFPKEATAFVQALDATIATDGNLHAGSDYVSLSMTFEPRITVTPKTPMPWEWHRRTLRRVRDLFALLMGVPVHFKRTVVNVVPFGSSPDADNFVPPMEVLFSQPDLRAEETRHSTDYLVPYRLAEQRFSKVVAEWFQHDEKLRMPSSLFLGTLYAERMFVDFRFWSLALALESLHRRSVIDSTYCAAEEWDIWRSTISASIPPALPEDFRDKLKTTLRWANEFSFRRRLKDLLGGLPTDITRFFADHLPTFFHQVVEARNALAHDLPGWPADGRRMERLFDLSQRLRIVLAVLLLRAVGFEDAEVSGILMKSRQITHLSRLKRWDTMQSAPGPPGDDELPSAPGDDELQQQESGYEED